MQAGVRSVAFWWRVVVVILGIIGLITGTTNVTYFTGESNVIVVVYYVIALWVGLRGGGTPMPRLRGAVVTWITVTMLVAHFQLNHGENPIPGLSVADAYDRLANWHLFVMHYIVPVVVLLEWLLFRPRRAPRWTDPLLWTVYPVVYGLITIIRGVLFPVVDDRYPYPFLDPTDQGWVGVALGLLQLIVTIAVIGYAIVGLDRLAALASRRSRA